MKVAFYKGKGNWVDFLIRKWTRSPYSHCEIVIDYKWYSSSPRDGKVREKIIHPRSKNWEYIDIDLSSTDIENIRNFFNEQEGKKYDYIGIILSQVLPLGIDNKNKWFCSEICSRALQNIGKVPKNKKSNWYNPGRLYNALKD